MKVKEKIKIVQIICTIIGFIVLLTFFLLGTFFDEEISMWFYPQIKYNFFGVFFEILGMGIYTIPLLTIIIVFINWLIFTKNKKVKKEFLILFYILILLILLVLDSISIFKGGNWFFWMCWTISLIFYLIIYAMIFFFFYQPKQIKKFKQNYYQLQTLLTMLIYIIVVYLTAVICKIIFVRPRIMNVIENNVVYQPWWKISWKPYQIKNNSFPSGHTAISMSLISFLFLFKNKNEKYLLLTVLIWIVIIAVGCSRIVYLKHFLTDVIASMLIGSGWFYLGIWMNQQKWFLKWGG